MSHGYVVYSNFVSCRKRKRAVLSDASGSDAEDNRSRRKKRTAVIGSGSEDSEAGAAKRSGDGKEAPGMVSCALVLCADKIHVKKTFGRPRCRWVR
jgi:hypothetical protein